MNGMEWKWNAVPRKWNAVPRVSPRSSRRSGSNGRNFGLGWVRSRISTISMNGMEWNGNGMRSHGNGMRSHAFLLDRLEDPVRMVVSTRMPCPNPNPSCNARQYHFISDQASNDNDREPIPLRMVISRQDSISIRQSQDSFCRAPTPAQLNSTQLNNEHQYNTHERHGVTPAAIRSISIY
jgi:hypothetical protein